jgi:hypothetical protein
MATLVLPPPPPAFVTLEENLAQGREGRHLQNQAVGILRHSSELAAPYLRAKAETEDISYRPVPFERAFTVRVKYRYRGEMKPRRITFDE